MNFPCIDGEIEAKPSQRWLVPEVSDVYAFYDLRGAVYVGQSCNLRREFQEHVMGPGLGRLGGFLRERRGWHDGAGFGSGTRQPRPSEALADSAFGPDL